jgi:hypothetical protein
MADAEDIQPLVCDNGTGMVKVYMNHPIHYRSIFLLFCSVVNGTLIGWNCNVPFFRLDLLEMMPHVLCFLVL